MITANASITTLTNTSEKYLFMPLVAMLALTACQKPPVATYGQISGETMGTSYHIRFELPQKITDSNHADAQQSSIKQTTADTDAIKIAIDNELIAFNNELSTWQDNSTITKFNKATAGTEIAIGRHFYQVLRDSKTVYQQSNGAFNPTVKPIIELWGFGKEMRVDRLQNPPTKAERQQAKSLIDFDSISFDKTPNGFMVKKTKDAVQVDFSAIAKGYGVDVIAGVLQADYKINNYMVEIGGEIATSGVNSNGQGWQIAIDAPILHSGISDRKLIATIRQPISTNELEKTQGSMHLATSGNYRNSIVFDGVRYSHTIDPATGNPVVGGASSVTVADSTVALADAWATALTAMPYEQALAMANELDKAVMFVIKTNTATDNLSDRSNSEANTVAEWQIVETQAMKALRAGLKE